MRWSGFAIVLAITFFMLMADGRDSGKYDGDVGRLPEASQMLIPFLIVAVDLLFARPRHAWHERRRAYDRRLHSSVGTPEEVLRQRFARGELTRDQYQEAIIELLKGRYVTGELTLEEYETRVGTLIADSRSAPPRESGDEGKPLAQRARPRFEPWRVDDARHPPADVPALKGAQIP